MPFPALWKEIYRVIKVTECHKISLIVLSTQVTEIISFNVVVYYQPFVKKWGAQGHLAPQLKKWGCGSPPGPSLLKPLIIAA
jgi:hypothetical protein